MMSRTAKEQEAGNCAPTTQTCTHGRGSFIGTDPNLAARAKAMSVKNDRKRLEDYSIPSTMETTNGLYHPHVASYLGVRDALEFAATSHRALESVLPRLTELHRSLFYERGVREETMCNREGIDDNSREPCQSPCHKSRRVLTETTTTTTTPPSFPPLQELLQTLADTIPPKYSNRTKIQALRSALVVSHNSIDDDTTQHARIRSLHERMTPIRLLRELISGRRMLDTTTSIVLHEYIGDVYCTVYLNGTIAPELRRCLLASESSTSYMDFVRRHANVLQHESSAAQRHQYGILHLPYYSLPTDKQHFDDTMTLIYDDFAPLGPQFRGRDIVRTLDVCRSQMQHIWMAQAHEQCRILRPMTVRPPEIRWG